MKAEPLFAPHEFLTPEPKSMPASAPRHSLVDRSHFPALIFALTLIALCSGCAAAPVKPWDRDLLAEKKMRYIALPLENAVDEHVYFSKEGSTGGQDVGGGGCGCN
jgi:hypothetical protein